MTERQHATLYRMALPDHICPFGLKAKELLAVADFDIDEHILKTREEVEAYKTKEGVKTTPQVFIDNQRIGGADDLETWLAHQRAA